jgi:hypothetical protein
MNGIGTNIGYGIKRTIFFIGMSLLMVSALLATFTVANISGNIITSACQLYDTVHTVIFVIGLVLIIVGAALYAGSHVLPGNLKTNAQGYGMGMIVGGVVGVIIALAAPFILQTITGANSSVASCPTYPGF